MNPDDTPVPREELNLFFPTRRSLQGDDVHPKGTNASFHTHDVEIQEKWPLG